MRPQDGRAVDTLQHMEGHRSTPGHRQRDFKWLSRGFKNLSRKARSLDEILFYPAATKPLTRDTDRSFFHPWTRFEIAAHFRCRVKKDNIVRHSNNTSKMDVQVYPRSPFYTLDISFCFILHGLFKTFMVIDI